MIFRDSDKVNEYVLEALSLMQEDKELIKVFHNMLISEELWSHSINVSKIATQMALLKGYSHDEILQITLGGLLHDVGKLEIPREVLYKTGKLSDSEFELIKSHSVKGVEVVKDCNLSPVVLDIIRHHHEKLNAKGYPDRISEISNYVQLVTVSDIFGAISEDRCYHKRLPFEDAFTFIKDFNDINQDIVSLLPVGIMD